MKNHQVKKILLSATAIMLTVSLCSAGAFAQDQVDDMYPPLPVASEVELDPVDESAVVNVGEMEIPEDTDLQAPILEDQFTQEIVSGDAEINNEQQQIISGDEPTQQFISEAIPEDTLAQEPSIPEDVFFDANEVVVPQTEMGKKGAPRIVDPRKETASKIVVVRGGAAAGTKKAQLVAAERAVKLGRFDSALMLYDTLYVTNKHDPNVVLGRAIALQKLGHIDEAIAAYDELLAIRPDSVEAQTNMLGLMAEKYPAVALHRLKELLEKNPNNVGLIAQQAFIFASMEKYQEAIRYLGMASSIEPENASHIFNMAIIAERAGAKKDAVKFYEQALEMDSLYGSGKSIPRDQAYERLARLR